MDMHMTSPAVSELLKTFGSDKSLFSGPPDIYGLPTKLTPSADFSRPSLLNVSDPVIIFSNIKYTPDTTAKAVEGWSKIVTEVESDSNCLLLTVIPDVEKGFVRTVAAYREEPTERKVVGGETGETQVFRLKKIAGYLRKEGSKA